MFNCDHENEIYIYRNHANLANNQMKMIANEREIGIEMKWNVRRTLIIPFYFITLIDSTKSICIVLNTDLPLITTFFGFDLKLYLAIFHPPVIPELAILVAYALDFYSFITTNTHFSLHSLQFYPVDLIKKR